MVQSLAAAADLKKLYGRVIMSSSRREAACGEPAATTWFCVARLRWAAGHPREEDSPLTLILCISEAGASKSTTRV